MDNTEDLPGYKYYLDAATDERPQVFVAFLDLTAEREGAVNGVVFPVDDERLAALDARERNYERVDVSGQIDPPTGGRVFAYFGTNAARERFKTGPTVIARAYLDLVRASLNQLGPREAAALGPPPVPIRDLTRVDLPPT